MSKRKHIFHASTAPPNGFVIKVLAENLKLQLVCDASLLLSKDGIFLCNSDNKKTTLINVGLPREYFGDYKCTEEMMISLNVRSLHTLVKNVKKKNGIVLFINEEKRNKLGIKSYSEKDDANEKKQTAYLTITQIRKNNTELPQGYNYPRNISSVDFQNMIKQVQGVAGKTLSVVMQDADYLSFVCDGDGVAGVEMEFGELSEEKEKYEEEFYAKMFTQLIKMPGFGKQMQFYAPTEKHYPLKIRIQAGGLGFYEVYIKDKYQVDIEERFRLEREGRET